MNAHLGEMDALESLHDEAVLTRRLRAITGGVRKAASGLQDSLSRSARELKHSGQIVQDVDRKLTEAHEERARDGLTNVLSRDAFQRCVRELAQESTLITGYWCVALLELDQLESVNKKLGDRVGDALLFRVAGLLHDAVATCPGSLVGRTGGKEFGIILSRCPLRRARLVAEAIRKRLEASKWECRLGQPGAIVATTVSVGLTEFRDGEPAEAVLRRAECSLEEAKLAGRNTLAARS
jgi:diguanylate cyclase (GGDEF)-like protein